MTDELSNITTHDNRSGGSSEVVVRREVLKRG